MGNSIADASHQMYDLGSGNYGGIEPLTGDWMLPAGNFMPAKMPLAITFPLNSLASADSYCKNAYPGVEWKIPIIIQGGAWPFKYEITAADGATGLTIGSELTRAIDGATGLTVHTAGPDYGVLTYANPTGGPYNLNVLVTDQDGNTINVPITLTVGTTKWLFVDPTALDQAGVGTIGDPFQVIEQIHADSNLTTTYSGSRVYLRDGTTLLDGMSTNNDNLNLTGQNNPVTYVGYPGEAVILEHYEGKFVTATTDDFYLANLKLQHGASYLPGDGTFGLHMIRITEADNRVTLFDVNFHDFKGDSGGGQNSSIIYSGASTNYLGISHCSVSGISGPFVDLYNSNNSVIEHLSVANSTTDTGDGSALAIIYLKDDPDFFTVRNCDIWDSITFGGWPDMCLSVAGQNGATNVEFCYNTLLADPVSNREGALKNFALGGTSELIENIYVYRNSIKTKFIWEGSDETNFPPGSEHHEKNVLDTGTMPSHARIISTDNIDGATYFDAGMELTGASRTTYLGTHGAEIAG